MNSKMEKQAMLDDLNKQQETLKNELVTMERDFNQKKEQFIRIQGAIEALNLVDAGGPPLDENLPPAPPAPEVPDHTEAAKALGV